MYFVVPVLTGVSVGGCGGTLMLAAVDEASAEALLFWLLDITVFVLFFCSSTPPMHLAQRFPLRFPVLGKVAGDWQ
jgi:hypothetical protein